MIVAGIEPAIYAVQQDCCKGIALTTGPHDLEVRVVIRLYRGYSTQNKGRLWLDSL